MINGVRQQERVRGIQVSREEREALITGVDLFGLGSAALPRCVWVKRFMSCSLIISEPNRGPRSNQGNPGGTKKVHMCVNKTVKQK